ncbi:type IV pilus biogenesis protein PilM [Azotobacter vinelandii]|uniref:type IV pilus biogenesis protein PilM n=1 Tax=Azotobacter vinelandii TaxID=354 RepID=UPI00091997C1|nr:type IV pilus biogenesis protein PilM [Azotobacter vinelandii]WKN23183.1 type IV pilus biogenesis protein PilM [Azotobacter vinelandii]SFY09163.1 PilM protein [Azotobacter vinelandii]
MYFYWIVLTLLIIASGLFSQAQHQDEVVSEFASVDSLSRSLLIYRSAATDYARANPGLSGIPADEALPLPAWYSKPPGVTAYVSGGVAYTYYSGTIPAGLPSALVDLTQAITVGVNHAGILVSPSAGNTGIAIPAVVPDGALVVVVAVN